MLAPTPVLRPSPLDIPGLFSASIEAIKRRFGLLALITLLPSIVILLVVAGATMLLLPSVFAFVDGDGTAAPLGVIIGAFVLVAGMIVALLVQVKSLGMLSLAAYEIAQGERPDFRGVLARSRGFLPRMASVIAITVGAVVALYVVSIALVVGFGSVRSGRGFAGAFAVIMMVLLAMIPLGIFLAIKFLYTVPAVAIEELGGIEAMKRSWLLTRGSFWRTLGYALVAYLAVWAVSYVVSTVGQVVVFPFSMTMAAIGESSDAAQVFAGLAALVPAMAILFAVQVAVQLVTYPFQHSYVTYMFIDQVRRSDLPAAPTYGYPGATGYYAQPGQYYGQPPQGYPTQWSPDPGRGWQQPGWTPPSSGQVPPPQQWGAHTPPPQWGPPIPPQQDWPPADPPSGPQPPQG